MLKSLWYILSFLLILIIFLRTPKESKGLSSTVINSNVFGTPTSADQNLNYFIGIIVICYLGLIFNLKN